METVRITFNEFLSIKATHYSNYILRNIASKHLVCSPQDIEKIDYHNFSLYVYLKENSQTAD